MPTATDPNKAVKASRMLDQVLDDLNNGQTPTDLAEALQDAVAAVKKTGKVATISFQLKIRPGNRGEVQKVEIEDCIKCNLPTSDRAKSFFFVDSENQLSRRDPNQPELDLKTIETPGPQPLRKVAE